MKFVSRKFKLNQEISTTNKEIALAALKLRKKIGKRVEKLIKLNQQKEKYSHFQL